MAGFSPSDAALEGFRLTRERPGTILAWSGIYFVGITLIAVAMMATLGQDFIKLAQKGRLGQEDMEQVAGMLAQSWPAFILVLLMTVLLISVVMAGIYRLVLHERDGGVAHLRIGRDEIRLALVNLVFVVMYVVLLMGGLILTAAAGGGGGPLAALAAIFAFAVSIWIGVRLSLATPMTFHEGKISIRGAWELSRGRFWSLFGMSVLAVIFYVIVWILITIIVFAIVEIAGGESAFANLSFSNPVGVIIFLITAVLQFVLQVLQIVMIYAPFAVAYQQIRDDRPAT